MRYDFQLAAGGRSKSCWKFLLESRKFRGSGGIVSSIASARAAALGYFRAEGIQAFSGDLRSLSVNYRGACSGLVGERLAGFECGFSKPHSVNDTSPRYKRSEVCSCDPYSDNESP
jgi:hypothetical protein